MGQLAQEVGFHDTAILDPQQRAVVAAVFEARLAEPDIEEARPRELGRRLRQVGQRIAPQRQFVCAKQAAEGDGDQQAVGQHQPERSPAPCGGAAAAMAAAAKAHGWRFGCSLPVASPASRIGL